MILPPGMHLDIPSQATSTKPRMGQRTNYLGLTKASGGLHICDTWWHQLQTRLPVAAIWGAAGGFVLGLKYSRTCASFLCPVCPHSCPSATCDPSALTQADVGSQITRVRANLANFSGVGSFTADLTAGVDLGGVRTKLVQGRGDLDGFAPNTPDFNSAKQKITDLNTLYGTAYTIDTIDRWDPDPLDPNYAQMMQVRPNLQGLCLPLRMPPARCADGDPLYSMYCQGRALEGEAWARHSGRTLHI